MRQLRREDIYDCLDDDAAFARLPGLVAAAIGARSAVFHWRSEGGGPLVLADSGYWSPEQMGDYVDRFAAHDIWAQSTLTARTANRLWVIDELVPERVYGNSVFYNDWIRLMGDDTYHCAGMSMAGVSGTGLIGLHRAKAAGAFEADDLARLSEHVAPVRRLMRVRGMLAEARAGAGELIDGLAVAAIVTRRDGGIVHANPAAERTLAAGEPMTVAEGRLTARHPATATAIRAAIERATDGSVQESGVVRTAAPDGGAGAWLLLVFVQGWSAANRRLALHRYAGRGVFVTAPLFAAASAAVLVDGARRFAAEATPFHVANVPALTLCDTLVLATFVALIAYAVAERRRVRRHAAAMLATPILVLPPILGRALQGVPGFPTGGTLGLSGFALSFHAGQLAAATLALALWRRDRSGGIGFAVAAVMSVAQMLLFATVGQWPAWREIVCTFAGLPFAGVAIPAGTATLLLLALAWLRTTSHPARVRATA